MKWDVNWGPVQDPSESMPPDQSGGVSWGLGNGGWGTYARQWGRVVHSFVRGEREVRRDLQLLDLGTIDI